MKIPWLGAALPRLWRFGGLQTTWTGGVASVGRGERGRATQAIRRGFLALRVSARPFADEGRRAQAARPAGQGPASRCPASRAARQPRDPLPNRNVTFPRRLGLVGGHSVDGCSERDESGAITETGRSGSAGLRLRHSDREPASAAIVGCEYCTEYTHPTSGVLGLRKRTFDATRIPSRYRLAGESRNRVDATAARPTCPANCG